jgi:hypothetical protein
MAELHGQENLKKLVMLGMELGNVIDKVVGHEEGGLGRWGALMDLADEVMALSTVEWKKLGDEYQDWSQEEKNLLMVDVKAKFDLRDDNIEEMVEKGLALALHGEGFIREAVALGKAMKEDSE